jgi:hypothetical protein
VRGLGAWGFGLGVALPLAATPAAAQQPVDGSADIFRRYADRITKIEVVETGSGAKASFGTGFAVTANGHLITNYHVVAETVHEPDRYRAQWLDPSGVFRPAAIVAIDVVGDLALLATGVPTRHFFTLDRPAVPKGTRLYSLGHPRDLGLSIVEGTYNGLLEHALYPKIHFTGPLNPGMSGGPALTAQGRVVGVNVSTGGNSVSFLVPVERALELVRRGLSEAETGGDLLAEAGRQALEHQDRYLSRLFADGDAGVRLGPFQLPSQPAPFFRCWGDAERDETALHEQVYHSCSTDDYLFLTSGQSSGVATMEHLLLTSRGLNPVRFYALYGATLEEEAFGAEDEAGAEVTDARCRAANVRRDRMVLRTIFCVRRYYDFPGLYDATLTAAVLGARDVGLVTTLNLAGVSFANAARLAKEYLGRIRWASR